MEGFLSLPRFARGGIAVLLAVALLGWAIVAYSAKQQHEDARSLESALVTLKSHGDREETVLSEQKNLEERLAAAEAELASSRDALTASREEKGEIEIKLAEVEAALADRDASSTEPAGQGGKLALLDSAASDSQGTVSEAGADQGGPMVDVDTLRARLTKTMTSLSAKNATLQQRERDLARAREDAEAAAAEIEVLQAASTERDRLRARLTENMTKLSAKSATLQLRERDLARAQEQVEAATTEIANLEAAMAERDALRDRLTKTMTTLSAKSATVMQKERELARLQQDYDEALVSIDALESSSADQEAAGRDLDALTGKLAMTKQALDDGAVALERNQEALANQQARLQELEAKQQSVEAVIAEKEAEIGQQEQRLATLADSFAEDEKRLTEQRREVEAVKAELADLALNRDQGAAESSSLTAEVDSLETSLAEKQDEVAMAKVELQRLNGEISDAEQTLLKYDVEIKGAEASLAALKADRVMAETEAVELKKAIDHQQTALADLALIKDQIGETKAELDQQASLLDEKRREVAAADTRLDQMRRSQRTVTTGNQSLPTIPIAELSAEKTAVLPIDPTQQPYPVQTEMGVRLALVHFDLGSAELTPGGLRRAKEAAAWIKEQGVEKIRLVGATDTIGTRENNLALAKRRAQTLFDTFAAEGVDPGRIELISMGEDGGGEAIDDQTAEPLNRCVGVFIDG